MLLEWSSPEAEEASAPSAETRPLSRVYRRSHYVFRCLRVIVPRRDNRVCPIDVDNRMNVRLLDWEELVMVTTLCRTNDRLECVLRHLINRIHSASSSAAPSATASTVSMVHHHLHSPPLSITCENGRGIRASDHGRVEFLCACLYPLGTIRSLLFVDMLPTRASSQRRDRQSVKDRSRQFESLPPLKRRRSLPKVCE